MSSPEEKTHPTPPTTARKKRPKPPSRTPRQAEKKSKSSRNPKTPSSFGRKNRKVNERLRKLNAERSAKKADRARSEKFSRWRLHTQQFVNGQGKHLRKATKTMIILLLLSQFITLSDQHAYNSTNRGRVFQELTIMTGGQLCFSLLYVHVTGLIFDMQ